MEGGVGESLIVRNIWVQGLELYTCKVSVFILKIALNWDKELHLPQSNVKPAARLPWPGPSSLPGQPPPCLGPTRPLAQAPHNLKTRPELIKWDFGTLLLCIPPPSCSRYSWPLRPPRGKLEGRSLPRQSVLLNKRTDLHRGQQDRSYLHFPQNSSNKGVAFLTSSLICFVAGHKARESG